MNAYFRENPAVFDVRVQLNIGLDAMPVEDAQAEWDETLSPYKSVGRLEIPAQTAWDAAKDEYFEDLSFSPGHALAAHRPLGGINRSRLVAYRALSQTRLADNGKTVERPTSLEEVPG